jgi:hypothetical protein
MIYVLRGSNVVQKKGRLFGNKQDYFIAIFGAGKFLEIFPGSPLGDSSPD